MRFSALIIINIVVPTLSYQGYHEEISGDGCLFKDAALSLSLVHEILSSFSFTNNTINGTFLCIESNKYR